MRVGLVCCLLCCGGCCELLGLKVGGCFVCCLVGFDGNEAWKSPIESMLDLDLGRWRLV